MALRDGILLWLPLSQLVHLYPELPERLIGQRLEAVNQISEETARRLSRDLGLPWDRRHIWLSSFQGELSDYTPEFVGLNACCLRALRLGNVPAYYDFCGQRSSVGARAPSVVEGQLALQSGQLEIAAAYLAAARESRINIEDLRSIPWTVELRRMLASYLGTINWQAEYSTTQLAGYLGLRPLSDLDPASTHSFTYVRGLLQGRGDFSTEEWQIIRQIVRRHYSDDLGKSLVELGVLPPESDRNYPKLVKAAFKELQPGILSLLPHGSNYRVDLDPIGFVSSDVLARASLMLELIRVRQLQVPEDYLRELQILLGQKIDQTTINGWEKEQCRKVCHPQVRRDYFTTLSGFDVGQSMVCYDMPNYIASAPEGILTEDDAQISIIYMEGCYLQALLAGRIPYAAKERESVGSSGLQPSFQQIYSELLAVANGQPIQRTPFGSRLRFRAKSGRWT